VVWVERESKFPLGWCSSGVRKAESAAECAGDCRVSVLIYCVGGTVAAD